jgi:hypothetical protein
MNQYSKIYYPPITSPTTFADLRRGMNIRGMTVSPPPTSWIDETYSDTSINLRINDGEARFRAWLYLGEFYIDYLGADFDGIPSDNFVDAKVINPDSYTFPDIDMIITGVVSPYWKESPNLKGFTLPVEDVIADCQYLYTNAVNTPIITPTTTDPTKTVKAWICNEADGGGVEVQNTLSNIETFAGVNSNGTAASNTGDFVELYSKDMTTNIGSTVFVSPNDVSIFGDGITPTYGYTTPSLKIDSSSVTVNPTMGLVVAGNAGITAELVYNGGAQLTLSSDGTGLHCSPGVEFVLTATETNHIFAENYYLTDINAHEVATFNNPAGLTNLMVGGTTYQCSVDNGYFVINPWVYDC